MKAVIADTRSAIAVSTLEERLFKYFSLNETHKWIDILEEIVKIYNVGKHNTNKMRPS